MTLIADVVPKLPPPKKVIKQMPAKSRFTGVFQNKHGKRAQDLGNVHNAISTIFVHPFGHNSVGKNLC